MPQLQVPISSLPAMGGSEIFSIGFKKPTGCTRDCEILLLTSQSGAAQLKVSQKEEGRISAQLTTNGGPVYSLDYCLGTYVWSQTSLDSQAAYQGEDDSLYDVYDPNPEEENYVYSEDGPQPGDPDFYDYDEDDEPPPITIVRAAPGPSCWYGSYYCDQSYGQLSVVYVELSDQL